uniref:Integrase family protein n=1 Tax=Methanococcus maripaludis (strain C6 / ATCC BAA-1332) TaxID=444158 RepID=A9A7L0_METM6
MKELENMLVITTKREPVKETPKMNSWVSKFVEEREFDGIKPRTIENDVSRLKIYLDFINERLQKDADSVENHDFIKFFNYLDKERRLSKNTQNRYFNLLKVFYKIMKLNNFKDFEEESLDRKRFSRFEVKHYDAIDLDTLNLILTGVVKSTGRSKVRDGIIIRLLWDTGCRLSEILNLRYKDCDFEEGSFKLRNTKGKVERVVVCTNETLNILTQYIKHNVYQGHEDRIFQSTTGGKVERSHMSKVFAKQIKKLQDQGLISPNRRLVIHSLRHGRAVDLLEKGMPIDIVKEYLGHASLETTLFYAHSRERKDKMLKDIKKIL